MIKKVVSKALYIFSQNSSQLNDTNMDLDFSPKYKNISLISPRTSIVNDRKGCKQGSICVSKIISKGGSVII